VGTDLLRVLVVDDHQMFAESVARILGDEADLEVVGVVGNAADARAAAASAQPDVVLLDFGLPDLDGATTARLLRDEHPSTQIVMLTGQIDDGVFAAAIEAGCVGVVTKDKASSELLSAVRAAGAGELAIPPATLARLLPILRRDGQSAKPQLTSREHEVLELLAEGASTVTIAERLVVSPHTVRNHVQRILVKLEVHSKLEAVAVALRLGLVDKPQ
jgi:DNA-binding NarL/FixJ family response regulator